MRRTVSAFGKPEALLLSRGKIYTCSILFFVLVWYNNLVLL